MIDRFMVRRSADGWGVWDGAVHGWRSADDMTEPEAVALEEQLNARQAEIEAETERHRLQSVARTYATRQTPVGYVVERDPPAPAWVWIRGEKLAGWVRRWLREPKHWQGEARIGDDGPWEWHPDSSLRERTPEA